MASLPPETGNAELDQWLNEIQREGLGGGAGSGTSTATIDGQAVEADLETGEVTAGTAFLRYLYQYLDVAYATDANGSNFSNTIAGLPTGTTVIWQGRRNQQSTSQATSAQAAAFSWALINNPTNLDETQMKAWYRLPGGNTIDWLFQATQPTGYTEEDGTGVIDLELQARGPAGLDAVNAVLTIRISGGVSAADAATRFAAGNLDPDDLAFDPDGMDFGATTITKVLVANVFVGGNLSSLSDRRGYSYEWSRNGQTFTPSLAGATLDQPFLFISAADLSGRQDQFICNIIQT